MSLRTLGKVWANPKLDLQGTFMELWIIAIMMAQLAVAIYGTWKS
jgi:hypothetical protein